MQYRNTSYAEGAYDTYWFEKNLQGDIVAVYSETGAKLIAYTYDAWGNFSTTYYNGGANTTATYNPFRYRGYYYDAELGFYYLNSRYYDPAIGRFITADKLSTVKSTSFDLTDKNLYAYCDNNPVTRKDDGGAFWDTFFDVVSLAFSVAEVVANPTDPMNWVGLVGDAVDLIPFVSGVGEVTRAVKTTNRLKEGAEVVAEASAEVLEQTRKLKDIKKAAANLDDGDNFIYYSFHSNGTLEYVGITNDFDRRAGEHRPIRDIKKFINGKSRESARIIEQTLIETFGMTKNGGTLSNKINSIAITKPLYNKVKQFKSFLGW